MELKIGGFTQVPIVSRYGIWVFPKIVVPQNGWFVMENPIKMDDLGIPLFSETSMYCMVYLHLPYLTIIHNQM